MFVSAPIVKRYDVFSLETADGVYLIIKGFINEQRTLENGFAPEVCCLWCFFGFPSSLVLDFGSSFGVYYGRKCQCLWWWVLQARF